MWHVVRHLLKSAVYHPAKVKHFLATGDFQQKTILNMFNSPNKFNRTEKNSEH